jgi:hypothetical protein
LLGTNTIIKKYETKDSKAGSLGRVTWKIQNIFEDGDYTINLAAVHPNGTTTYDWWDEAASFKVFREARTPYIVSPEVNIIIEG